MFDCINMITNGFLYNSLMLNMDKTQLVNIHRTSPMFPSVRFETAKIVPLNNVKNCCLIFNNN